ncbi:MAG: FecR domain-containing protein, partial [Cyanobacteriota bacterium]|nr:FecR domain-containing protein [Cyanobacteriota bacterium]
DGEAFFEVEHDPSHPFRITLPHAETVEVLGTEFAIQAQRDADQASVLVYSGKVRFEPVAGQASLTLTRAERGIWQRSASKLLEQEVHSFADLQWHSGKMEFKDATIKDILKELEATYNIQVTLEVPEMGNCTYSSTLPRDNPEKVLEALAEVHGMQLKITGEKAYLLSGGTKCQ